MGHKETQQELSVKFTDINDLQNKVGWLLVSHFVGILVLWAFFDVRTTLGYLLGGSALALNFVYWNLRHSAFSNQ